MAFLLSSLGLPGEILGGLLGSHAFGHSAHAAQKPLPLHAPSFGSVLGSTLNAAGANDPSAQLTNLVQNGTPIASIVDRLAGQVADAVGRQLHLGHANRTQLVNSIKAALSPPSNAPPGQDAAQQVAALAGRLQKWLTGVAREADQRVGQQSESSGQVLDAKAARELPAQHDPDQPSTSLDISALAGSLLSSVASSLTAQPAGKDLSSAPTGTLPATADGQAASMRSQSAKDATRMASDLAKLQTSQTSTPGKDAESDAIAAVDQSLQRTASNAQHPAQNAAANASQAPAAAAAQTAQNPVDLLARMLVRAAGVDARLGGGMAANPSLHSTDSATSQLASLGRMTSLLTQAINGANASGNDGDASGGGSNFASAHDAKTDATTNALAFNSGSVSTPSSFSHLVASQNAAASSAPADPHAVVEQVVKGMQMRSAADGSSEVRLRLQPESLGTVTMKLVVSGDSVSATAVAQNADVRNTLMAHQHQLARALADSGLKLTSFNVDLSGGNAGQDRQRDRTSGFGRHYTVHEVARSGGPDATESTSAGPSIIHSSKLELFNYLA